MHSRILLTTGLLALPCLSYGATTCEYANNIENATEFALSYGFPLYPFRNSTIEIMIEANGTNKFYHATQLADPTFNQVVSPNVDTLYSAAVIDLSHHDIILELPEVNDRYYVFALYDVWGDNYLNMGTTSKSAAGKYRIRFSPSTTEAGLHLCSSVESKHGNNSECDGLQGVIDAVTPYGSMQPRYAVNSGDAEELEIIQSYQNQSSLTKVPKSQGGCSAIPAITMRLLNSTLSSDIATQVMQLTSRIAPYSPARNSSDQSCVDANLKAAGIEHGKYEPQAGQEVEYSFNVTQHQMSIVASSPVNSMSLGNNWTALQSSVQGDFGTNYLLREYVATTGYLMLKQSEALYPRYSTGDLSLSANEAYVFTFESKPPLIDKGFWSLTAYNAEHFLISNDEDVYSRGSNSNITYSDGTLIYGDNDHTERTFQLLIQPDSVKPPSNWTSNWIPAPADGGDISLILRVYGPADGVTNGTWKAPLVTKQNAITA
ncbi:DUF1254-domain-containing protein [Penicillium malachiteum]|uniref:DUF1254-domain-containing protein n=1 Tax=Penicillium malachiteum TaxID=1324776 RepID=A0AAD6HK91_9EURO|nr:DUF1254-domain-containing protein [Penicillium malachiteum]